MVYLKFVNLWIYLCSGSIMIALQPLLVACFHDHWHFLIHPASQNCFFGDDQVIIFYLQPFLIPCRDWMVSESYTYSSSPYKICFFPYSPESYFTTNSGRSWGVESFISEEESVRKAVAWISATTASWGCLKSVICSNGLVHWVLSGFAFCHYSYAKYLCLSGQMVDLSETSQKCVFGRMKILIKFGDKKLK